MLRAYKAIRPALGFTVDEPPKTSNYTAELFATIRDDGRIGDTTMMVLGGRSILNAEFHLDLLFDNPAFKGWKVHLQKYPMDLDLRRGLLSGLWHNVADLVETRDAMVEDASGTEVPAAQFLRLVGDDEEGPEHASFRWAVVLTDSAKLGLQLQGMPASASTLMGKPSLKR